MMARGRLLARDKSDALPRHERAALDVAVDHGAAQRPRPEMLDLELRVLLRELAAREPVDHAALERHELARAVVRKGAHRDHRKARVELLRRHGVARAGADEGLLEARMRDRFIGADEARAELHAGRAHLEISDDRLAAADPAGDEHRHIAQMRQDLLRQHAGRDRADMAASFHALDDDGIGAHAHEFSRDRKGGREADHLGAAVLDARDRGPARHAAREHDVADAAADAHVDERQKLGMERDEIDAERPVGEREGAVDLGLEKCWRHGAAGDDAEAAGIGDRGDEIALGHPGHCAAHHRRLAAQKLAAAAPQEIEAALRAGPRIRWHRGRRRCEAPARRARYILRRRARSP